MSRKFVIAAFLVFALPGLTAPAQAQRLPVSDDYRYTGRVQGPVYNPDTKSYFELRYASGSGVWEKANERAGNLYYKNAQGRLAIVSRPEIHQFIVSRFKILGPTWIGLQYFCRGKKLKWVDGTTLAKTGFTAWNTDWANTHVRCADMGYMPVSYVSERGYSPLWQAAGPHKGYQFFLIEYPTGKE